MIWRITQLVFDATWRIARFVSVIALFVMALRTQFTSWTPAPNDVAFCALIACAIAICKPDYGEVEK
jgi:hypothetical protein